ncbi:Hypothetical_protein [Hexamita inflata]|uniref:Hypothetical_protein n=1 Tax=Hexamita inflata TaxID=28002 RepID=A0AA86U081_9EUKA|nr:Hypothetical protein HINF_LOCUS24435 [Hexamita inflata]
MDVNLKNIEYDIQSTNTTLHKTLNTNQDIINANFSKVQTSQLAVIKQLSSKQSPFTRLSQAVLDLKSLVLRVVFSIQLCHYLDQWLEESLILLIHTFVIFNIFTKFLDQFQAIDFTQVRVRTLEVNYLFTRIFTNLPVSVILRCGIIFESCHDFIQELENPACFHLKLQTIYIHLLIKPLRLNILANFSTPYMKFKQLAMSIVKSKILEL